MLGKLDDYLKFHERALGIRAQRQELLASNIANADTPNFKARDVEFASVLKGALSETSQATSGLKKTAPMHLDGIGSSSMHGATILYRTIQQGSVDGNTVNMDVERNEFADNAIRYEAGLTMINTQIKNMLAAIQGQ